MALIDNYQPVKRRPRGARINAPSFTAPNTEALSALRGRAGQVQSTIDNPLAAPGVSGTLSALNTQLVRQAQAARGQAMGRATSSGQGGFAGTMAQAGTNIEGALGDARYQGQAGLVADTLKSAQEELMQNLRSRGEFEGQLNAQQLDRTRILADVANQNAQLDKEYWAGEQAADLEDARRQLEYRRLMQAAADEEADRAARLREFDLGRGDQNRQFDLRLGEDTRQFNVGQGGLNRRFDVEQGGLNRRFDLEQSGQDRRFDATRGDQNRQFDLNRGDENRQFDQTRAEQIRQFNISRYGTDQAPAPYRSPGGGRSSGSGGGGSYPERLDYLNERDYSRNQAAEDGRREQGRYLAGEQERFQMETERNNAMYQARARQEEMQRRADEQYRQEREWQERNPNPYRGRYNNPRGGQ